MAQEIGMETDELLRVLKDWKKEGKLRRIGAIVNHFKVGLPAGAMVVWRVGPEQVEEVGQMFLEYSENQTAISGVAVVLALLFVGVVALFTSRLSTGHILTIIDA